MKRNKLGGFFLVLILTFSMVMAIFVPSSFAGTAAIEKGTATISSADVPAIIGTPESNIRFALWNGSIWFELPFTDQESVQNTCTFANLDPNGTNPSVISTHLPKILSGDAFSVQIPAINGVNASDDQWWSMALNLGLCNRESIKISDSAGYSPIIYVYYEPTGPCIPPDYSSDTSPTVDTAMSLNQTQTGQTGDAAAAAVIPSGPVASFSVISCSTPQIAKELSTDPEVVSNQNIMEQLFSDSGNNELSANPFYLPAESAADGEVMVELLWTNNGDPYSRDLYMYINTNEIYSAIVYSNTSTTFNLPNADFNWWGQGLNTAGVTVTTWVGSWDVTANIYVVYNAASTQNTIISQEYWAQWYKMPANSNNIVFFPTSLPNGLVYETDGDVVTVQATAPNANLATLNLYINYAGTVYGPYDLGNIGGTSGQVYTETYDISMFACGMPSIGIGIQIDASGNWGVQGWITSVDRPGVAPDGDPFWTNPNSVYAACMNSGSLYMTNGNTNYFAGTYATEVDISGAGYFQPSFYTTISASPNPIPVGNAPSQDEIEYLSTQLSYSSPNNPGWWEGASASYAGASSGGSYIYAQPISQNAGADLLSGISFASLSYVAGETITGLAGLVIGVGYALYQYGQSLSCMSLGTQGTNSNTIVQQYNGPNNYLPFSMSMKDAANFPNTPATYTLQFETNIQFLNPLCYPYGTQLTVYNSFPYTVT